jgi:hypothetical protein
MPLCFCPCWSQRLLWETEDRIAQVWGSIPRGLLTPDTIRLVANSPYYRRLLTLQRKLTIRLLVRTHAYQSLGYHDPCPNDYPPKGRDRGGARQRSPSQPPGTTGAQRRA